MTGPRVQLRFLLTITAVLLLASAGLIGLGRLPLSGWVVTIVAAWVVGSLLVVAAVFGERGGPTRWGMRGWLVLVGVGVVARLLLLPAPHYLSDDAYRYHWDGKVLSHGINPYRYAPDAPEVAFLRTDAIDERINHPDVVTVYPPLAQVIFAAAYRLSPGGLWGFNLLCLLAEVVTWVLLARECRRRGLSDIRLVIAIWFPLLIFEGYLPGHTDVLGLPFLVAFLAAVSAGRPGRAGVLLGLACLIKPVVLLFVPAVVRELGMRRALALLPGAIVVGLLFYAPFLSAGENLVSSAILMARKWSYNGSLAAVLELALRPEIVRPLLGVLLAGLIGMATVRGRDLVSRALLAFTAFVIVTPTLYPWYLTWMFPLLVLRPDPALLVLGGLIGLTELVAIDYYGRGEWDPGLWPRLVAYVPFYLLLVVGVVRGWGVFNRGAPLKSIRAGTSESR